MYQDTVGKVTVGAGLMLPDAQTAAHLPFQYDNRPATTQEIAVDFRRVASMVKGKASGYYRSAMSVLLTLEEIDAQLRAAVMTLDQQLRKNISTWDALPQPAKLALLDMAYNLGLTGLLKGYPKMLKAVVSGDWQTAAAESHRNGPPAARNDWTSKQFLASVTVPSITAEAALPASAKSAPVILPIEPVMETSHAAGKTAKKAVARKPARKAAKKTASRTPSKAAKKAAPKPAKKAARKSAKKRV